MTSALPTGHKSYSRLDTEFLPSYPSPAHPSPTLGLAPSPQVPSSSAPGQAAGCVHWWLMGQPKDGVVPGRCKHCGATREDPARPVEDRPLRDGPEEGQVERQRELNKALTQYGRQQRPWADEE